MVQPVVDFRPVSRHPQSNSGQKYRRKYGSVAVFLANYPLFNFPYLSAAPVSLHA